MDLRQLGGVAWIVLNAGTVGQAMVHYRHYNRIACSGIDYQTEVGAEGLAVRIVGSVPNPSPSGV